MIDFLNSDREKRTKSIRISMLFVLFFNWQRLLLREKCGFIDNGNI